MKKKRIPEHHQKQLDTIGIFIKNIRLGENLSQLELSEQLNLHHNTIQRIEKGANSTLLTLFELADYMGYKPYEILEILD